MGWLLVAVFPKSLVKRKKIAIFAPPMWQKDRIEIN